MKKSVNGKGNIGCMLMLALIGLCMAVSWAMEHPKPATVAGCAIVVMWLVWFLWKKHRESVAMRKAFDIRFGAMLDDVENNTNVAANALGQFERNVAPTDRAISEMALELNKLAQSPT